MTTSYVIRYNYPGTVNGKPVGVVYAERVRDSVPNYPEDLDAWSYSKTPEECVTKFSSVEEAKAEMHRWAHNSAEVVAVTEGGV